ncbi:MAG: CPBP family intramembrane metalloprotease [Bacteroidales bacterium]|nr:CPBP family intramembrane metalloprotease [Bacteroidales bacterium]
MNKKEKKPRLFRWALWWGLGIVVVCLAIMITEALSTMGESTGSTDITGPMYDVIYRLIYQFGIWPIIIYIGVIGPVFEELCFRLWGDGKQWTGYTSVGLMSLWGLLIAPWIGLLTLAAGIVIMAGQRNDRTKRLFALMMLSTLIFALAHISNYDASEGVISFVVAILHKVGMGLVASYLVINHNILWSMGLHILNNGVLAVIFGVGVGMAADTVTTTENKDCRITLRPVLTKSADKDTYVQGWLDDSTYTDISTPGNIAQTLNSIAHMNGSTTQCDYEWSDYPKAEITVVMLGGCRDYTRAVRLMEEKQWIALDTVEHADSVRTMYVGDSSYTIAVERTVTIRNTYEPLAGI